MRNLFHTVLFLRFQFLFSIYAIGDAVHGPMLAHKAEDEGEVYLKFINVLLATQNNLLGKIALKTV